MKAVLINEFGGPEVFQMRDMPKPQPGVNEVLVKVHATSINPVDIKVRQAGSWAVQPPDIIGYDVSGEIEAVGEGVLDFVVGDEVYYTPEIAPGAGSYAEYNVVSDLILAPKPENITHEEAASIPLAGGTAWDALITNAKLRVGETALIHGAGGVGSLALQIAKAAGARTFVVCSDYMVDTARELGADLAVAYQKENFADVIAEATDGQGVDVVVDTVGGETLTKSVGVTKSFGRMVSVVSTEANLSAANAKNITVHYMFLQRARYKLDELRKLIERGRLKPVIDSVLPLEEVAEAHRRVEAGGVRGKVVLDVAS